MRHFTLPTAFAFTLLGSSLFAQTFPEPRNTAVNDYADMLPDESETRITETLDALTEDTGVEATIVTLSSVQFYAQNMGVNEYATALFNDWGVGDPDKGDGVLLLVFRDDRLLRIELGDGYDTTAADRAQNVISQTIIPQFMESEFAAGSEAGATRIAEHVVRNDATPAPVSSGDSTAAGKSNTLWYILGGIGALAAALFGMSRRAAAKLAATPCSSCGVAGQLTKSREVLVQPTETTAGKGEVLIACAACGHVDREPYTISKKRPDDDFKGGKSKGDGATGKW